MIRKKRFQNRVAEGRWLLPLTVVFCSAIWWVWHEQTTTHVIRFACFLFSTWMMVEWNVRYNLLRTYSRLMAVVCAVFTLILSFTFTGYSSFVVQLSLICCLYLLMGCYDDRYAPRRVFYAFLCMGIGSVFFFPLIVMLLLMWLVMILNMRIVSGRALVASILGYSVPYWLGLGLWCCNIDVTQHLQDIGAEWTFGWHIDFMSWSLSQIMALGFMLLSAVFGIIHYVRQRFADKTFVRLMYYCFLVGGGFCLTGLVFMPHYYAYFALMLAVFVAPLVAHLFTHTYTRWTNLLFKLWLLALILILGYSIWKM